MRVILDTGAFFHPEVVAMIAHWKAPVVVPTVVVAERSRQLARAGVSKGAFAKHLQRMGLIIESLGLEEALRYAADLHDERGWARLARDAFIAGHVGPGDRLMTTNARDFVEIGVPVEQIVEVPLGEAGRLRIPRKEDGE